MSFDVGAFAARVNSFNGFQSPAKFRVRVFNGDQTGRALEFLCAATDLPGVSFASTSVKPLGYGTLTRSAALGPVYGGGVQNLTFYDDNAKLVYTFFREWQQKVSDSEYAPGGALDGTAFRLKYLKDYAGRIEVTTFSQDGAANNRVVFHDAWPFSIGPSRLDWSARDQIAIIPVTIAFTSVTHPDMELSS